MKNIIDELIYERAPWLQSEKLVARIAEQSLKILHKYDKTVAIAENLQALSGIEIFEQILVEVVRNVEIFGLTNVPKSGPALLVSNHPMGVADAIFLYSALRDLRPDVYFFANRDVLRLFPQLSYCIAPVEWRQEKRSKLQTKETLTFTKCAMAEGKFRVIF